MQKKTIPLESLSDADLLEYFLRWEDAMIEAFNGHRRTREKGTFVRDTNATYTLYGKNPGFVELEAYLIRKGLR